MAQLTPSFPRLNRSSPVIPLGPIPADRPGPVRHLPCGRTIHSISDLRADRRAESVRMLHRQLRQGTPTFRPLASVDGPHRPRPCAFAHSSPKDVPLVRILRKWRTVKDFLAKPGGRGIWPLPPHDAPQRPLRPQAPRQKRKRTTPTLHWSPDGD